MVPERGNPPHRMASSTSGSPGSAWIEAVGSGRRQNGISCEDGRGVTNGGREVFDVWVLAMTRNEIDQRKRGVVREQQ